MVLCSESAKSEVSASRKLPVYLVENLSYQCPMKTMATLSATDLGVERRTQESQISDEIEPLVAGDFIGVSKPSFIERYAPLVEDQGITQTRSTSQSCRTQGLCITFETEGPGIGYLRQVR